MQYKNVWISSEAHIETLMEVFKNASIVQRTFGTFDIPEGFPRLVMWCGLFSFPRAPLGHFEQGTLTVDSESCSFRATRPYVLGNRVFNVPGTLKFDLDRGLLESIDRYQSPSAYTKYFSIRSVRIKTKQDLLDGDFLLCVGGWRMGRIHQQTDQLFESLQTWVSPEGAATEVS